MFISDDNVQLKATLDMPADAHKKCPLVIVIHGFTGYSEERHIAGVARIMNELGYATLRVDMYGHGGSGGRFCDHTLFKWMTNAMTVIDYARALPFVTDLYLCGHSQGGLTVILAAALKHEFIRGIIPLSPAVMIPEASRQGEVLGVKFDPNNIPDELISADPNKYWTLNGNYARAAQMIHVEEAFARYTGPVLLVHADTDEVVPFSCSENAARSYHNASLVTIPDDTHCYDNHLEMVLDAIKNWLPDVSDQQK